MAVLTGGGEGSIHTPGLQAAWSSLQLTEMQSGGQVHWKVCVASAQKQENPGSLPHTSAEHCAPLSCSLTLCLYSRGKAGAGSLFLLGTAFIRILAIKLLLCVSASCLFSSLHGLKTHLGLTKWWTGIVFAQEV